MISSEGILEPVISLLFSNFSWNHWPLVAWNPCPANPTSLTTLQLDFLTSLIICLSHYLTSMLYGCREDYNRQAWFNKMGTVVIEESWLVLTYWPDLPPLRWSCWRLTKVGKHKSIHFEENSLKKVKLPWLEDLDISRFSVLKVDDQFSFHPDREKYQPSR